MDPNAPASPASTPGSALRTAAWVVAFGVLLALFLVVSISSEVDRQRSNEQVRKTCPPSAIQSRLALTKPHLLVLSCSQAPLALPPP